MKYLFPMIIVLVFLCVALIIAFCVSDVRRVNKEEESAKAHYRRHGGYTSSSRKVTDLKSPPMLGTRHGDGQNSHGNRPDYR